MSEDVKKREILQLRLDQIDQVVNSRVTYDKEDLAELMSSMRARDLLSPIGVRKTKGGRYEIVFGNRRLRAAQKLDWKRIDAVLADAETDEDVLIVNAVENMQRKDVPFAEQGRTFASLISKGLKDTEIAAKIGIPVKRVKRILKLYNEIPKSMRPDIITGTPGMRNKDGNVPSSTATLVIDISSKFKLNDERKKQLLKYAGQDGVTSSHVRRLGGLMRHGYTLSQAQKAMESVRVISLTVAIPTAKIEKLEDEYGIPIHDIIYNALKQERWLGVVQAVGKTKR